AHYLQSDTGHEALADIEAGRIEEARRKIDAFRGPSPFGFPTLADARRGKPETNAAFGKTSVGNFHLRNIHQATEWLNVAGRAGADIEPLAAEFQGVGVGKTGFLSQFLGSGRVPTLDVNALGTYFGSEHMGRVAQRSMALQGSQHGHQIRAAVIQRHQEMQDLGYLPEVPRQHLPAVMHHALFDAAKGSQTTHEAIFSMLERAGQARAEGGTVDVSIPEKRTRRRPSGAVLRA